MEAPLMLSVSGMRGIVGASLTPAVATRFGRAFASYLRDVRGVDRPRVVLARDGRAGGEVIRDAAGKGLAMAGCQVLDIEIAMTPTVGVAVDHLGADGALIATASHNPQEWNGLKSILAEGGPGPLLDSAGASAADAQAAAQIIERFHRIGLMEADDGEGRASERAADVATPEADAAARQLREIGATRLHMDKVLDAIGAECAQRIRARGFVVAVDSVNASGVVGARLLLSRLGCTLRHIGGDETGVFPHTPEPTRENLVGLSEEIRRRGAAVGFAQDPDGDRLAIVDERGDYIGEEYTLVLAAMALFELGLAGDDESAEGGRLPAVLCANLSTSRMIDDVAAMYGARVVRTAVGEANVVSAMREHAGAAPLGGEGNGGVIWPRVTLIRDSLSAMALVLGLMARTGKSLSALVSRVPRYAIVKRKVELALREDAARAIAAVEQRWSREPGVRIDRQDGVRIDFDDQSNFGAAWIHVRASNTEPIMRLIAEAASEETACRLLDAAANATRKDLQ